MKPADLIARVRAAGGTLAPAGSDLDVAGPPEVLTDDLMADLRAAKPEVLALLRAERQAGVEAAIEAVTGAVASAAWRPSNLASAVDAAGDVVDDAARRYVAGEATREDLDAALCAWAGALAAARPVPVVRGTSPRRCLACGATDAIVYVALDDGGRICGRCWRGSAPREVAHA